MTFKETGSKVYLDMDGLLANLFDAVALKLTKGEKHYKELTPEEKQEAKRFWGDREHFEENFGSVDTFFANLPLFGENGELTKAIVDTANNFAGKYYICTCPARVNIEGCKKGKLEWIHKHLKPAPNDVVFAEKKSTYAVSNGIPNILVDDFPPYIEGWRNAGGIAIELRTDSFKSIKDVVNYLSSELIKAERQIIKTREKKFDKTFESFIQKYRVV